MKGQVDGDVEFFTQGSVHHQVLLRGGRLREGREGGREGMSGVCIATLKIPA